MSALHPRLLRDARATRAFVGVSVALGLLGALLIVAQAWLIADTVTRAFQGHQGVSAMTAPLAVLLGVVLARAAVAWAGELAAGRSCARVKSQLRGALMRRVAVLGPDGLPAGRRGELAVLATRGIDALDAYFAQYLPQLLLAAVVPVVVLIAIVSADWISAAIVAFTIPLIPVFMALVGATTHERMARQLTTLQRLSGHFLDVVAGLPTLKVFGRAKAQARSIAQITDRYRVATLRSLRVAFLSSLILELVAVLSVALVAVAIGLRLMNGQLGLRDALFVLVLAPEAYLPLRRLGASYHASAEGVAALEQVAAVLDMPAPARGARRDVPDPALTGLSIEGLTVGYPGRGAPVLRDVSLEVGGGEIVALAGPSGCGKSTLLGVVLGLVAARRGTVWVGEADLADLDPDAWRSRLAWVPQRPHLFAASITDNVRLGRRDATDAQVAAALRDAGLARTVDRLPAGAATLLGERGAGLSAGERQRLALARAFVRDAPLLLLDEPTANLDGETELEVLEAVARLARGRTVLLAAHRPALLELADRVVDLGRVEVAA